MTTGDRLARSAAGRYPSADTLELETALRGRTLDPAVLGARIRQIRTVRGLTQHDLADGVVSTAYVSRIETGQRRPSHQLLGTFAVRLGVAVSTLVSEPISAVPASAFRFGIARAELFLASGAYRDAAAIAERTETAARSEGLQMVARDCVRIRALALRGQDNLADAIALLETLTLEKHGDAAAIQALTAMCWCRLEVGDVPGAIDAGEQAWSLVKELALERLPEALDVAVALSDALLRDGKTVIAAAICRSALAKASGAIPSSELGDAYKAASAVDSRTGAMELAVRHAERATVVLELTRHRANLQLLRDQLESIDVQSTA